MLGAAGLGSPLEKNKNTLFELLEVFLVSKTALFDREASSETMLNRCACDSLIKVVINGRLEPELWHVLKAGIGCTVTVAQRKYRDDDPRHVPRRSSRPVP